MCLPISATSSDYPNTAVIVTRAFVETQRSLAKNLLKSEIESIHYIRTNETGSLKILKKYLKTDETESGRCDLRVFRPPYGSLMPRARLDGIKNILKEMNAPQRSPADFVDMSLLDELEKEGFLQRLR